jgi:hypothetical protein
VTADECNDDASCAETLACLADPEAAGAKRCLDPCAFSFCTEKATCSVIGHKPFCSCPPKFRGDPSDPNIGCYAVECEADADCNGNLICDQQQLKCTGMLT